MKRTLSAIAILGLQASLPAHADDQANFPAELDAYVASALRDWQVPGAALAVVKDGTVIVAKGYGVRELGKTFPVDERTIFDTASLTKSFTSAAIATLVDEGKLKWDQPVHTYLPRLSFYDPFITENVTLRDLLSHRVGVRNNSAWYFGNLSREQIINVFAHIEPQAPFRSSWVYSNIGYQAAAEVASEVSGSGWEQLVTERLLGPLGMDCSVANFDAVPRTGNYASPHAEWDDVQRAVERETARMSTAAAGAVQMCAKDMATWLLFQLGDGSANGKKVLSSSALAETHTPQVIVTTTPEFRTRRQVSGPAVYYGFGWNVWDYRGELLLWHTGSGNGQSTFMGFLPRRKLGVALAVNTWRTGGSAFPLFLSNRIFDYFLNAPARDYLADYRVTWERNRKRDAQEWQELQRSRLPKARAALDLDRYAGKYRDSLLLDVDIMREGPALVLRYAQGERGVLEHWHDNTFRVLWARPFNTHERRTFVTFIVNEAGQSTALTFRVFDETVHAERIGDPS